MKKDFQAKWLESVKFDPRIDNRYFDEGLSGLELRVGKTGCKTFFLRYSDKCGNRRVFKLGRFSKTTFSLADVRTKARNLKEQIANEGYDPAAEKSAARSSTNPERKSMARPRTWDDAIHQYLTQHIEKNGKGVKSRSDLFRVHIQPRWGHMLIDDTTRQHGIELVDEIEAQGHPVAANRAVGAARAVINWLLKKNKTGLEYNPLLLISADKEEVSRDRFLTDNETRVIWNDLVAHDTLYSDILKVLFYTGQRRGEVGGMTRGEVELGRKVWTLRKERTKNRRPHTVHLSAPVVDIIERRIANSAGDYIFGDTGDGPYKGWNSKTRLDRRVNIPHWTIHDIRRTVVTGMTEYLSGERFAQPHIVEAVVNHISGTSKAGVAGVYNRAVHKEEREQLLDAWAAYLDNVILNLENKVVPLHG